MKALDTLLNKLYDARRMTGTNAMYEIAEALDKLLNDARDEYADSVEERRVLLEELNYYKRMMGDEAA